MIFSIELPSYYFVIEMRNIHTLPDKNTVESIKAGSDSPRFEGFTALTTRIRESLRGTMEDMDRKFIFILTLVLFMLGCSAQETKQEEKSAKPVVPSVDTKEKKSALEKDIAAAKEVNERTAKKLNQQKLSVINTYVKKLVAAKKLMENKKISDKSELSSEYNKILATLAGLLGQPVEKVREIINQLSLSKTDIENIPDVSLDLEQHADLAEALAYADMGIVVTEEEKLALRKEVGLPTDKQ